MMRNTNNTTPQKLIAFIAMWVVACPVFAGNMDKVQVKPDANSDDNLIQLREIAFLTGDTAQKMGGSIVMELREGQKNARIPMSVIHDHLSGMGVNWGRMNLTGAAVCQIQIGDSAQQVASTIVTNPVQAISTDNALTIHQQVIQYLQDYCGYSDQELVVVFSDDDQKQLQQSALQDRFEIKVFGTAKLGSLPLVIRRWRNNAYVGELRVTANVSCKTLALVAVNNIRRGQSFGPDDVQVQEVLLQSNHTAPMRKLRDVIGMVASRSIRRKQTLFATDIEEPVVISRGQMTTVRVIVGGMVIRTTARAMSDAGIGQMVQLQNERSREEFMARVTGPREAVLGDSENSQLSLVGGTR